MATDQQSAPAPVPAPLARRSAPGTALRAELHVVLGHLVAAADAGRPLDAFLNAAGAAQIVADRLQGAESDLRRLHSSLLPPTGGGPLNFPRTLALHSLDAIAATTAAARGRLGLADWHVTLRDLANVLAEAVLRESFPEAEGPDARGVLLSVATTVDALRSGIPPQAARLLAGTTLEPPSAFRDLDLHPADVVALAERFAAAHPDRERPLLVLGLRCSGAYLAPLAAAALGHLEYRHVVARTTRAGGPLLPEEPRLTESVRRVGGLVLLLSAPPRTGSSLASVAARLTAAGFAAERVVPVYPALDDRELPLPLLRHHPAVVLPAACWRIAERLRPASLAEALAELLPDGHHVNSVQLDSDSSWARSSAAQGTHRAVDFSALVTGPDGEQRRLPLRAEGAGIGCLGRRPAPGAPPQGVVDGVLITERTGERTAERATECAAERAAECAAEQSEQSEQPKSTEGPGGESANGVE